MIGRFKTGALVAVVMLVAGCADRATPVAVLAPPPEHKGTEPTQIGVACAYKLFWIISYGDSHIREAKKQGGVQDIATVEVVRKVFIVDSFPLNFYQRQCTEISGYS